MAENQRKNILGNVDGSRPKNPLTYAIVPEFEEEIREYVDHINRKTDLPKQRIVSDLLIEAIRRAKKICPLNSENSENSAKSITIAVSRAM